MTGTITQPQSGLDLRLGSRLHGRVDRLRRDLDALLIELIPEADGAQGLLAEAMRYAVVGAGKRFRAMLVVAVAELVGGRHAHALRIAAAVECVHAQSLVHDDLPCMDDDDLRRGKPTLHRRFDEATAVLAGDTLLTLAFEILAHPDTHPYASVRVELIADLARALGQGGMAAGQMMDLHPEMATSPADALDCQLRKTGALIRFAITAGLTLGTCSATQREGLLRYADNLGLAFQMRDDLLDRVGEPLLVGKRLRKDVPAGRRNPVDLLGLSAAEEYSRRLADSCRSDLACFGADAAILAELADFAALRLN